MTGFIRLASVLCGRELSRICIDAVCQIIEGFIVELTNKIATYYRDNNSDITVFKPLGEGYA